MDVDRERDTSTFFFFFFFLYFFFSRVCICQPIYSTYAPIFFFFKFILSDQSFLFYFFFAKVLKSLLSFLKRMRRVNWKNIPPPFHFSHLSTKKKEKKKYISACFLLPKKETKMTIRSTYPMSRYLIKKKKTLLRTHFCSLYSLRPISAKALKKDSGKKKKKKKKKKRRFQL